MLAIRWFASKAKVSLAVLRRWIRTLNDAPLQLSLHASSTQAIDMADIL
jgi:hypothetical protein